MERGSVNTLDVMYDAFVHFSTILFPLILPREFSMPWQKVLQRRCSAPLDKKRRGRDTPTYASGLMEIQVLH